MARIDTNKDLNGATENLSVKIRKIRVRQRQDSQGKSFHSPSWEQNNNQNKNKSKYHEQDYLSQDPHRTRCEAVPGRAQAVTLETLSLRDMAKHITSHGSPFTADVVIGVLEAFRSCLIEQLLESKKVKVQGLGTFYVTIANKEGGIKNLADFNINTLATGLRLRFLPEGATEESISSKDFLKKAKFVDVATLTKDKTVSDEETDDDDVTGGDNGDNGGDNGGGNGGGNGQLIDDGE